MKAFDPRFPCHVIDNRCGYCFACKRSRIGLFTRLVSQ